MVKNTQKMVGSSNSTTMYRNIYRERFPIRRGKKLQWSIEQFKTKSSNLILFNFQEEAKFSAEKHKKNG